MKKSIGRILSFAVIFTALLAVTGCRTANQDLSVRLERLPGCSVEEVAPKEGFERSFVIDIEQPLDHENPRGEKFIQRVFLNHRDTGSPFVMHTSGYSVKPENRDELTDMIDGNLLFIPHRYYEYALPDDMSDFSGLNIEQSAADLHRINRLFRKIYTGKFVATGRSKGGLSALFYRYFYPEDVDVTVAIVAPIMYGKNDPRITASITGDPEKAVKLAEMKAFQRMALGRRKELAELFEAYRLESGYSFSEPFDEILEEDLLEIYIQFWQYGNGFLKKIPGENAGTEEIFRFINTSYPLRLYAEGHESIDNPFYYQVYNEIGYYQFTTEHLEDLLLYRKADSLEDRYPVPGPVPEPDAGKMKRISDWLYQKGDNIIYVYGALDPFTGCAVEIGENTNALKIVQQGKSHVFPLISLEDYFVLKETLFRWLEL